MNKTHKLKFNHKYHKLLSVHETSATKTTLLQPVADKSTADNTTNTINAENAAASAEDLTLQQFSALSQMVSKHHSVHIVLRSWYDYFSSAAEQEKLAQLSHTASLIPGETLPGKNPTTR